MAWLRRDVVPAEVRALLALGPGERLLAAAPSGEGWVVATTHALWIPLRSTLERVAWESVDNATWDRDEGVLRVAQAAPLGERPRRWVLRLDDARDLLLVVKERVRATVVTSRWTAVSGEAGVTVVARRSPSSGRLTWNVSVDRGVDLADPATKARVDEAVQQVQRDLGV